MWKRQVDVEMRDEVVKWIGMDDRVDTGFQPTERQEVCPTQKRTPGLSVLGKFWIKPRRMATAR